MRQAIPTALLAAVLLSGCAGLMDRARGGGESAAPAPARSAPTPQPILAGPSATPASFDTVSEAAKAEARAVAAAAPAGGTLGEATVSLGDPTDPGLWVKTSLVAEETPGTVRTGSGEAIAVTLRPLPGAGGAQASLSAMQALGLPLAGLHPVTLERAG